MLLAFVLTAASLIGVIYGIRKKSKAILVSSVIALIIIVMLMILYMYLYSKNPY